MRAPRRRPSERSRSRELLPRAAAIRSSRSATARSRRSTASRLSSTAPSSLRRRVRAQVSAARSRSSRVVTSRRELAESDSPEVEVAGTHTEDSLDRRTGITQKELAPLEIGHRLAQSSNLLLEPLAARLEECLELLLWCRSVSHSSRSVFQPNRPPAQSSAEAEQVLSAVDFGAARRRSAPSPGARCLLLPKLPAEEGQGLGGRSR